MITIIDYGAGNLASVQKAIEKNGATAYVSSNPNDLFYADKVIFPGVGAFGKAMEAIESIGMDKAIKDFIKTGKPFLGICLGLHLLFETSEENPGIAGLSVLKGAVKRFSRHIKVPHLGWNQLIQVQQSPLWVGIPDNSYFYFAHSYYISPRNVDIVVGECHYDGNFPVAIKENNVFGLQFHPEKSQELGLNILKNFVEL